MESKAQESLQEAYKKSRTAKVENERPQPSSVSPSPPPTPSLKADSETFDDMPQLHRTISGASKKVKRPGMKRRSSSGSSVERVKQELLYDDSEEMASDPEIQKYAVKNDGLQWGMGTLANEKKWKAFPKASKPDVEEKQN